MMQQSIALHSELRCPSTATRSIVFVDLDGTLISSDLLLEGMLVAAKKDPAGLLNSLTCVVSGRAAMKRSLADRVMPCIERLPIRSEVVALLQRRKASGARLVLATASDRRWAEPIARHVGLFDDVLASDGRQNLKGQAKLAAINAYCRQHGFATFEYLGDSTADLAVWRHAAQIGVVAPTHRFLRQLARVGKPVQAIGVAPAPWRGALRAMRPQQWVKNVLVFMPLVLAHQLTNMTGVLAAILAFVAFCCCASATYVLNDLLDLDADRSHPKKSKRPFASGQLPLAWGPPLVAGLFLASLAVAAEALPALFTAALACYAVLTLLYSFWLKRKVMLDVLLLAGLYTLRILAGGLATGTPVSEWLMAFSLFLFTSLAFGKRYIEFSSLTTDAEADSRGRGYMVSDLSLLESLGSTSGYMAVLVLALYIHADAARLYPHVSALWLICPLMLYWVSRFWILAKRRSLSEDPIVFALKDRVSRVVGLIAVVLAAVAAW